jgi:trehalose/maltose hydrolase-like predicted phosphorylase
MSKAIPGLTRDPHWLLRVASSRSASGGSRHCSRSPTATRGPAGRSKRAASPRLPRWSSPASYEPARDNPDPPKDLAESPALVGGPNWLALSLEVDGRRLSLEEGEILAHERILDLRQALVVRRWQHRDGAGRVKRVVTVRWAPSTDRHALCQRAWVVPENYGGRMRLTATLDGPLAGAMEVMAPSREGALLEGRTRSSGVRIAAAQAAAFKAARDGARVTRDVARGPATVREWWEWDGEPGREYALERVVTLSTSRETPDPVSRAVHHASRVSRAGTTSLVEDHRRWWAERWRDADVEIRGDAAIERALRVGLYHLIAAANPEDERVSIGARSLTGPAYHGHVFWDTEIYALPFFVFTWPEVARALLMYRYWTLDAARAKSGTAGTPRRALCVGVRRDRPRGDALECPGPDRHRDPWAPHRGGCGVRRPQYWRATGDDDFPRARGCRDRAGDGDVLGEPRRAGGRRALHVRGVVGPDKYHDAVDDSAYTNAMARWNLEFLLQAARWLREHDRARWGQISRRLELSDEAFGRWRDVA